MYKAFRILLFPLLFVEIILLKFYKLTISPLIGKHCKYTPSCSVYMLRSILTFDAISGAVIGMKRLLRCDKKHFGGIDLEPLNIVGDYKWVC